MNEENEYLGHSLTPEGVKPNSKKVEAARGFSMSKNAKESTFTNMAVISRPLTALTRKNVEFVWIVECEAALEEIKQRLMTALVLRPLVLADHLYLFGRTLVN